MSLNEYNPEYSLPEREHHNARRRETKFPTSSTTNVLSVIVFSIRFVARTITFERNTRLIESVASARLKVKRRSASRRI